MTGLPPSSDNNSEEIKNKFTEPFNEEEVISSYQNAERTEASSGREFFSKILAPNIRFLVSGRKTFSKDEDKKAPSYIGFEIQDLTKDIKNNAISSIQFASNEEQKQKLEMIHRDIRSQDLGINGSMFLEKAFEYLRVLKKHNYLEHKEVTVNVSQPSVVLWLKENKFSLGEGNIEDPDKYFSCKSGERVIVPEKNQILVSVNETQFGKKDPFIFDSRIFENTEAADLIKKIVKSGEDQYSTDYGTIQELIKKGYIPNFLLTKAI